MLRSWRCGTSATAPAAGGPPPRDGGRRVFLLGLALFASGSLVAGLAQDSSLLFAGRVLQGVADALVLPATLASVAASFRAGRRGVALGIWSAAGSAALALGPLAGALLTERLGWASIFLFNVHSPRSRCSQPATP